MKAKLFRPFLASIALLAVLALGAIPVANVSAQMPGYMGPQMGYSYAPYPGMAYPYSGMTYPYMAPSYTYTTPAYVVSSAMTYPSIQISGVYPPNSYPSSYSSASYSSTYSSPSAYTTSSSYSSATYGYLTSSVMVSTTATLGPILTDGRGMTLYMLSSDAAGSGVSTCYDKCPSIWPVAWAPSGNLNVQSGLSGNFGSIVRSDGTLQVTYNGKPLYFFSHDMAPGDTNGQGITDEFGHWTVAQP